MGKRACSAASPNGLREENKRRSDCFSSSRWSCLPRDLLDSILDKLACPSDYIRFSAVCRSWNSVAANHRRRPLFLIVEDYGRQDPKLCQDLKLHSLATGRTFHPKLTIPRGCKLKWCCGCSRGWLIYFLEGSKLLLLNPFSSAAIQLPRLDTSFLGSEVMAILSRDPTLGQFEVLACCPSTLAHLKFGDEFWTYSITMAEYNFLDCNFTFYKDNIFGVTRNGAVLSVNVVNGTGMEIAKITPRYDVHHRVSGAYPVETTDANLLMVIYYYDTVIYEHRYKVLKLVHSYGKLDTPTPVADLGGHSLLLEPNNSKSVLASDYFQCRPNSIYCTYGRWTKWEEENDMCIM